VRARLSLLVVYLRITILILLRKPYKLTLLITDGCNLRCQMCSIWKRRCTYLTLDEVKEIWAAFVIKPCWINISGGEPSLNRELGDILAFFASLDRALLITITTNGQLDFSCVVESVLKISRKCVFFVSVSNDGVAPLHDWVRGRRGAFSRAARAIAQLRALARSNPSLSVGLSVTISRANFDQILPFLSQEFKRLPVSVNLTQSSAYYGNDSSHAFTALPRERLINLLRLIQYLQPKLALDAILKVNYLERTIRFLQGKPSHGSCASIINNVLVTAQIELMDCSLKFRPWDSLGGSRTDRLLRVRNIVRNPAERRAALTRQVKVEHCERTCHTPCENYVQLLAELASIWSAPGLVTCFIARTLESWSTGRSALRAALSEHDSSRAGAHVALPIATCESAES
jgi:sulfatase maturation enzyme AslB (radical SAM superfamily)